MLLYLVAALAITACLAGAQQPGDVTIVDGTAFVAAAREAVASGSNGTRLVVTNNITLPVFEPLTSSSTNVRLSVVGQPSGEAPVLLDARNEANLLPRLLGSSQLTVQNLSFINLCHQPYTWDAQNDKVVLTATNLLLFGQETNLRNKFYTNLVMYVTAGEVQSFMYWTLIQNSVFTQITNAMPTYLAPTLNFKARVADMTRYSIRILSQTRPSSVDSNLELHATSDPALAGLPFMQPAFCNGTNLTAAQSSLNNNPTDRPTFPLWIAYDSDSLHYSLYNASLYTQSKAQDEPAPIILLINNMVLGGDAGQFAAVTLRAECLLHGPLQQGVPPAQRRTVVLNLGTQPNNVQLAVRGRLYISNLLLTQLIVQPLGQAALEQTGSSYQTGMPLWGINMVSRQGQQVFMDSSSMVLPQADYAALLSAALRGPAWQSGARTTRPLMQGINSFVVDANNTVTTSTQSLFLLEYQGWGVYATNLTVVPAVALPADYPLPDLDTRNQGDTSSSGDKSTSGLAVGVGVGVGGAVVAWVACMFCGFVMFRRMKHKERLEALAAAEAQAKAAAAAEEGAGNPPSARNGSGGHMDSNVSKSSGLISQLAQGANGRKASVAEHQLNVAALHAAVKARQAASATASGGSQAVSDNTGRVSSAEDSNTPDPKRAVQQAVGALGTMDADKLTLLGVLGRGTWGTVYRGQWRNLDVAVKTVLFSNRTDGKGSLPHERAIMEAAVCTSVSHRNVVATYHYDIKPVMAVEEGQGLQVSLSNANMDLLTTEWKLYLVQEWCNTSMGAAMRSGLLHNPTTNRPLMDVLLTLLIDTANGLQYLHDKHIIHGDLKPENVMLKMDPTSPIGVVAKITDFGLSTTLGPQATHVSNFNSGTPFYVAPEVVSEGRVTKASDIYSLGVVLWELYNCSTPWVRGKDGAYNLHPAFTQFPPHAPACFLKLTQQCVQRDARLRPSLAAVTAQLHSMHQAWLAGWDSLELGQGDVAPSGDQHMAGNILAEASGARDLAAGVNAAGAAMRPGVDTPPPAGIGPGVSPEHTPPPAAITAVSPGKPVSQPGGGAASALGPHAGRKESILHLPADKGLLPQPTGSKPSSVQQSAAPTPASPAAQNGAAAPAQASTSGKATAQPVGTPAQAASKANPPPLTQDHKAASGAQGGAVQEAGGQEQAGADAGAQDGQQSAEDGQEFSSALCTMTAAQGQTESTPASRVNQPSKLVMQLPSSGVSDGAQPNESAQEPPAAAANGANGANGVVAATANGVNGAAAHQP